MLVQKGTVYQSILLSTWDVCGGDRLSPRDSHDMNRGDGCGASPLFPVVYFQGMFLAPTVLGSTGKLCPVPALAACLCCHDRVRNWTRLCLGQRMGASWYTL